MTEMSSKRRKIETKKEKEESEKVLFRSALKKFIRKKYTAGLTKRNSKRNQWQFDNYLRECDRKGDVPRFNTLEEYRNDDTDLGDEDIEDVIESLRIETLLSFYESFFGEKVNMGKTVIVQLIFNHWKGIKSDYTRRKTEISNIDETYIHDTTEIFRLNDIGDVLVILSFLPYDFRLLKTVGSVNSSYYLLILTSWKATVTIRTKTIHKISVLVLKSMECFYLHGGLEAGDYEYLIRNITPSRIRLILYDYDFNIEDMQEFFDCCVRSQIAFTSVREFYRPQNFERPLNIAKVIRFPKLLFPNLRKIDDLLLRQMNLSECQSIEEIVIGNLISSKEYMPKEFLKRKDTTEHIRHLRFRKGKPSFVFMVLRSPIIYQLQTHQNWNHLWNKGSNIRSLKCRIRLYDIHYCDLCRYILYSKFPIEKLKIIVKLSKTEEYPPHRENLKKPEDIIFSGFPNLKQLTIKQEELFSDHPHATENPRFRQYTLLLPKTEITGVQCLNISKVDYYNVPISICQSSMSSFPNLKFFRVVFSGFEYLTFIEKNEFRHFFEKFVKSDSFRVKVFHWVPWIHFVEDNRKVGKDRILLTKEKKIVFGRGSDEEEDYKLNIETRRELYNEKFEFVVKLIVNRRKKRNEE